MDKQKIIVNFLPYLDIIKDTEKIIVYELLTDGLGTLDLLINTYSENTLWLVVDRGHVISESFASKFNVQIYDNFKQLDLSNNILKKRTYIISERCNNDTLWFCTRWYFRNYLLLMKLEDEYYLFPDRLRIKYYNAYQDQDYCILTKDNSYRFLDETLSSGTSVTLTRSDLSYVGNLLLLVDSNRIKQNLIKILNQNSKQVYKYSPLNSLDFMLEELRRIIDQNN